MADKFAPHVERLHAVAASPSRKLLAMGGERDIRGRLPGTAGSSLHVVSLPHAKAEFSAPVAGAIHALAFASDELLLAGLATGAVIGWDPGSAASGKAPIVEIADAHRGAVRGLACDAMGTLVASCGDDGVLRVGKVIAGKDGVRIEQLAARTLSNRPLRAVAIDAQATTVAVGGEDGVIRSLPLAAIAEAAPREMPCGEGGITALCFTGDGRIAAGCGDGSLHLCFLEGAVDAENRSGEAAHASAVRALIYSPELYDDAKRLLPRRMFSIADDGTLRAWQLDTQRKPRTLELSSKALGGMVLIPAARGAKADRRGGTLAVVGQDRRLTLILVTEEAEPADSYERIESQLARLGQELDASNPQVRIDALRALGALEEDDARELLDRVLARDRKPEVRKAAAEAIGASNRRLSRPALRAALGDSDASVRKAAFAALSEVEKDAPLSAVRAALACTHADIRTAAVKKLPALRSVSPLVPGLVAERLSDSAQEVRLAALDALYALEGKDSVEPVRIAMLRGPADIRRAALIRLGRGKKTRDALGRTLLEAGLDDSDASVRESALLVLVAARADLATRLRAVDEKTRKALDELEKDGSLRDGSADELTDDDLQPLFAALTCRNADTALRAARFLGLLGDSRATGALLQLSREGDVEVRRAVVDAILGAAKVMPGDSRLTARLRWLLDDRDATVRTSAFDALAKLAEPEGPAAALELAGQALRSSQEDIRLRALAVLVEFGGQGKHASLTELSRRADERLGHALDDENANVRGEAFNTLWAWHGKQPEIPLQRGAACRHADIRRRVVSELERIKGRKPGHWSDAALLSLVRDTAADVGLAAFQALTETKDEQGRASKKDESRAQVYLAALESPRAEVRAAGCKAVPVAHAAAVRARLIELVRQDIPQVHIAAIEAIDRLMPDDAEGFAAALASIFYDLRTRALELLGKRRDTRAVAPARELLTIPETRLDRPSDGIRQRVARALADVGDHDSIDFYVSLLEDKDAIVREMGARGLASACRPGNEQPLVNGLAHPDLAVRSWVAEGLARLGDDRAVPVLAGTLRHDHQPIRQGAIMGLVALGPDGVGGILQGLEDPNREIQDLVFAVIVARDVALQRAGQAPDLLLSALSSANPEIRFAAARILESRMAGEDLGALAQELVGPRKPDKAADMKDWPAEDERLSRLNVLIAALASDHPAQRYAAAQVLTLRGQPLAFWREAGRLMGPTAANRPRIPYTNWEDSESFQPRKKGWIRSLFGRRDQATETSTETERVLTVLAFAGAPDGRTVPPVHEDFRKGDGLRLAFGIYAGLVRQAPARGESDETHRVRRDSIDRLAELGRTDAVGRHSVMPVLRRALSDPHHLVRKAAVAALASLYPSNALEPQQLALDAMAADVGRGAVDALVAAAMQGNDAAAAMARGAVDAPVPEVRAYAMSQLPRLFAADSLDPWLIALSSRHADVRFAVVDRLVDSLDPRVPEALGRAMESDHEDLRLKAAAALARRGDVRTVDVLSGLLRSEEARTSTSALDALVALAHARPQDPNAAEISAQSARAVAGRIEDDPDRAADRNALISALGRVGSPAGADVLLALLSDTDASIRKQAFGALMTIARDRGKPARTYLDGTRRVVYREDLALPYLREAATNQDVELRKSVARTLRDIDDRAAEELLGRLIEDRDPEVRVLACEALAFRAEYVTGASIDLLASTLRAGRRELVLPAAVGMANRGRPEAFQALLLVFKAGEAGERERAVLALGSLGDRRALEELEPLIDKKAELEPEDAALVPIAVEALGRMLPRLRDTEEHGPELTRVRDRVELLAREGEDDLRKRALTGLRMAGDDRSRALIERIAGDRYDDDSVRVHAVKELGRLRNPASTQVLADLLHADDYTLRHTALAALRSIFPTDRTRTSLLALRSEHSDISEPAASFLAQHGDSEVLVARLSEVANASVRQRLRQGLIRRGACPVAAITALLAGDSVGQRADAAWIAGAVAPAAHKTELAAAVASALERAAVDWSAAQTLITRPDDETGHERLSQAEDAWRACMWAAERLGADAGASARKVAAMREAPASVRREALRWLAAHGQARDAALVQPGLTDADAGIRVTAAAALAALSPQSSQTVLSELAVADAAAMGPVAEAALDAAPELARELLGQSAGRQLVLPVVLAKQRLAELVAVASAKGKDPARLVAIASLGRAGSPEAAAALRTILDNKNDEDAVRAAAYKALRRLERRAAKRARFEEAPAQ